MRLCPRKRAGSAPPEPVGCRDQRRSHASGLPRAHIDNRAVNFALTRTPKPGINALTYSSPSPKTSTWASFIHHRQSRPQKRRNGWHVRVCSLALLWSVTARRSTSVAHTRCGPRCSTLVARHSWRGWLQPWCHCVCVLHDGSSSSLAPDIGCAGACNGVSTWPGWRSRLRQASWVKLRARCCCARTVWPTVTQSRRLSATDCRM